jgi:hypothetical protein
MLGDLERLANAVVVGAKTHQTSDDRFIGSVSFTRARKRTVQLDLGALRRSADETASQQTEPARAGGV